MQSNEALTALAALAQDTRLAVFRLLVRESPEGLPAGRVAAEVGVAPATLSFHLAQLERAGLLSARRKSRQIYYAAHPEGIRGMLSFLTEDCCGGRPELCGGPRAVAAPGKPAPRPGGRASARKRGGRS